MRKTLWDNLPFKQYRAAQEQHLTRYIREMVYPFSPYYHELMDYNSIKPGVIKTLKDISSIPFTTKADIAPLPEDLDIPLSLVLRPDKESMKEARFFADDTSPSAPRNHPSKGPLWPQGKTWLLSSFDCYAETSSISSTGTSRRRSST